MIHARQNDLRSGFTLVELLLSMSFVSVLLLSIAMLVIQIGNIYNKGVTIKAVNQAGRALSSELQGSIAQSPQFDVSDTGGRYVTFKDADGNLTGGRLCLGSSSYIWNDGKATKGGDIGPNKYLSPNESSAIRFIKFADPGAEACVKNPVSGAYPSIDKTLASELLNASELSLSVYNFKIASNDTVNDERTGQRMYNISFLLGTDIKAMNNEATSCRPPSDLDSDINYCSINEFNFVARAGNVIE